MTTIILPFRLSNRGLFVFLISILLAYSQLSYAQNGSPCYQPITGFAKKAVAIQGGTYCPNCPFVVNANNITDANLDNFATIAAASIAVSNGVTVIDSVGTYPAGYQAGYVVSIGSALLSTSVLNSIGLQTWNNGVQQEAATYSTGLSVALAGNVTGRLYLNFKTTLPFDEVRFVFVSPVGTLPSIDIYYAMAFDANCGLADGNAICMDQVAGPGTVVNTNLGTLNLLSSLTNPERITDGNKTTYASLTLPTGTSLLSNPPYIGVLEKELVHPAGHKAGFVIGYSSALLTADVLSTISVATYLHGEMQDSLSFASSPGLLSLTALTAATDQKKIELTTTLPFNEVRFYVAQTALVNVGTVDIYYAYESGATCTDGQDLLVTGAPAPNTGSIVAAHTGTDGLVCVNQSLLNTGNVVTATQTDFATYTPSVLGVGCTGSISVTNTGTDYPAGTYAGFTIAKQGDLVALGLLNAITINVYKDGGSSPVASSNGAALLGLGVLNSVDGKTTIGFKPGVPFDEIQIVFNSGLINASLDGTYQIYNAFVVRDDDNDGVPDPIEQCGPANDAIDTDGDGMPDACDVCNMANAKSVYADTDGDGIYDACDADSDNDGIADAVEDWNMDGNFANDDADGDGMPNYLDLDSDNDGIPDLFESGISAASIAILDADHNGVIDGTNAFGSNGMANAVETNDNAGATINYTLANTDGDGAPDYLDLDTDNDGINDITECGYPAMADANNDGMVDGPDADRDGIQNTADNNMVRGATLAGTPVNTDNDPIPDYRDLDSDNDYVSDLVEGGQGALDANNDGVADGPDTDGDGIQDSVDGNNLAFGDSNSNPVTDTDNDNLPDYRDPDRDNSGGNDIADNGLGYQDMNGDGMVDNPTDPDGDGIPNNGGNDNIPGGFGGLGTSTIVNVKILLQGGLINPATDLVMRDDIRVAGLIPLNQPYSSSVSPRFTTYDSGDETTTTAVLNANAGTGNAIVDWVLVEVRSSSDPLTVIRTVSALVQLDGDIVGADGNSLGMILPTANYYLSVKHRNHLGIMTATAVVVARTTNNINFMNGTAPTYGTNAQKQTQPNVYAMWGGDVNADGEVFFTATGNDRDAILVILGGNIFGYLTTYNYGDVNLDAQTYFTATDNDRDWLLLNVMSGNEFNYIQEALPQ